MKIAKFMLGATLFIIIIIVLILGYFGFMPVLSPLMGANKPKDLGIANSQKEYMAFSNKVGNDIKEITTPVSPDKSIEYSGVRNIDDTFSQEEISGRLNNGRWKYMPVGNVQVRINNDGTVEFSANVLMDRLPGFIAREGMGKYTMADVTKGLDFIKMIKLNPPVYMKFTASISNNSLQTNIGQIEVGRFNIPLDIINANQTAVSVFNSIVSKVSGFYAKSVTFSNGKMKYQGTIPEKMKIEVVN